MKPGALSQKIVAILCAVLLPSSLTFAQVSVEQPQGWPAAPEGSRYQQAPQYSPGLAYQQYPSGPAYQQQYPSNPAYQQSTPYQQAPQYMPPAQSQQGPPLLSPQQLDNLVAPVALYPDPLLGQVLAASTYPLEVVEAQQWLQQDRNLQGQQLIDAAKQQNWDPSVQALVAFPDVVNLLANDVQWTTGLGNAFLAQQTDVMNAVQTMRARAQANGRLQSTPQQVVTTETQNGQSAIEIQPANPQVIYVPVYQPEYVYGPPAWGAYPDLWSPPGFGFGFGFGTGILMSALFAGFTGWGLWGWGLGWFGSGCGLFVNGGFFNHFGFHGGFGWGGRWGGGWGGGWGGRSLWAHDPGHRMGVPYPNRAVASRFGSNRFVGSGRYSAGAVNGHSGFAARSGNGGFNGGRSNFGARSGFGQSNGSFANGRSNGWNGGGFNGANRSASNGFAGSSRQMSPTYGSRSGSPGYGAVAQSRGYGSTQGYRGGTSSYNRSLMPAYSSRAPNYSASRSYTAPRQSFSSPGSFSGGSHFSGGGSHFSGGRSFGGGGGHSFGGGGGHSFGGGGGHFSGGHGGGGHGGGHR
jgi:hypothetical protein